MIYGAYNGEQVH